MEPQGRGRTIDMLAVSNDETVRRIVGTEAARMGDALRCRCVPTDRMLAELSARGADVVVLDAGLRRRPVGLVTLRSRYPQIPVVAVSPTNDTALSLLNAGAVDFLYLPLHGSDSEIDQFGTELAVRVRIAAMAPAQPIVSHDAALRIVAIACAKGGPVALAYLLRQLPAGGPPVLILQHHARVYGDDFAHTLGQMCNRPVRVAEAGRPLEAGAIHLYTGSSRPQVAEDSRGLTLTLGTPARRGLSDALFGSLAALPSGVAAGVLLPCPGCGGWDGLQALARGGGWAAWMDRNAVLHDPKGAAANEVRALPLEDIAAELAARMQADGPDQRTDGRRS